ncbi:hypothetical protein F4782DRAFT_535484 [Xylaria castorea]|nr:hypothetical protein F4782DRAFT_535484 [Xylaria castorea]
MGGKIWTETEERYFWRVAVSQSTKRVGSDREKEEKCWDLLAVEMQHAMGDSARRQYTGNMLFEHFFQNTEIQRRSPNAYLYVQEYLAKRDGHNNPTNSHDHASPSSTFSVFRRSQYIKFVTEPEATEYSQAWPPHPAPYGDPSTVLSRVNSPSTSNLDSHRSNEILDSAGSSANTPITIGLSEEEEEGSELEEGEIRE